MLTTCFSGIGFESSGEKLITHRDCIDLNHTDIMNMQHVIDTQKKEIEIIRIFLKVYLLNPYQSYETAYEIAKAVYKYSHKFTMDEDLILAIIRIESFFNPRAESYVGARGLMQVMPLWIKQGELCSEYDLYNIDQNIRCGVQVYKEYLQKYENETTTLCAYNQGPYGLQKRISSNEDIDFNGYAKDILMFKNKLKIISELTYSSETQFVSLNINKSYYKTN
jgi:soluble lytic murein transglycosylase-like protein